jgi:hypothetical protein
LRGRTDLFQCTEHFPGEARGFHPKRNYLTGNGSAEAAVVQSRLPARVRYAEKVEEEVEEVVAVQ